MIVKTACSYALIGVHLAFLLGCTTTRPALERAEGTSGPPANSSPVARANLTSAELVPVGATASAEASSSSDPDGDPLTFDWIFTSAPPGSNAFLLTPSSATTSFVVDVAGTYELLLTVSDGLKRATATLTVQGLGISSVNPTSGPAGTSVTITGHGFLGPRAVSFNGTPAAIQSESDDKLVALAPAGATSGPVVVTATVPSTSDDVSVSGPVFSFGSPPPPVCAAGLEPVADAYIQGGSNADTPYGTGSLLVVKGTPNLAFARKVYLAFDLASAPKSFTSVVLRLTLDQHAARNPRVFMLYGVIDDDDWDLTALGESNITWNNAPRNDPAGGVAFIGAGTTPNDGVRLVAQATLDYTDPPGTTYDFDVTEYLRWALGGDPAFSTPAPGGDSDGKVTLLLAHESEVLADDGSVFNAREDPVTCHRPLLVFN
jgi:IPT/TIG domain/Bacterial Ig domain